MTVPDPNATPSDANDAAVAQPASHPVPRNPGGTAPDGASASGTASAPSGTAPDGAASAPGGATSGPGGGTASGAGADARATGTSVTATSSTDAKVADTSAAVTSTKVATKKAVGSARSAGPIEDTEVAKATDTAKDAAPAEGPAPAKASTAKAVVPAEGPAETAVPAGGSSEAADPADADPATDTATPAAGTADTAPTEDTDATSDTEDDDAATDSASASDSQPARGRRRWSRRRRTALAVVTGLGVLVLLWVGAAWWNTANLAPGSSISGVAVGGMSLSEARQAVATQMQDVLDDPVTVTVNGSSAQITPSKAGVSVDAEASVERLTRFTLNPATIFNRFTGARVDAVVNVDPVALTGALGSHLDELATGTANASVILNGTTPVLIPASAGNGVDIAASVRRLTANWPLGKTTIELDAGQARPTITDAAAQAFINDTLNPLLSAPLTITAAGTDAASISAGDVTLSPEQVAELQGLVDSGRINDKLARQALEGVLAGEGSPAQVVEARGLEVVSDDGALTAAVQEALDANPDVVEKIKGGKVKAAGALVGAVMKATRGQADAARVRELIMEMVGA